MWFRPYFNHVHGRDQMMYEEWHCKPSFLMQASNSCCKHQAVLGTAADLTRVPCYLHYKMIDVYIWKKKKNNSWQFSITWYSSALITKLFLYHLQLSRYRPILTVTLPTVFRVLRDLISAHHWLEAAEILLLFDSVCQRHTNNEAFISAAEQLTKKVRWTQQNHSKQPLNKHAQPLKHMKQTRR